MLTSEMKLRVRFNLRRNVHWLSDATFTDSVVVQTCLRMLMVWFKSQLFVELVLDLVCVLCCHVLFYFTENSFKAFSEVL